jgi:hypothetical protein
VRARAERAGRERAWEEEGCRENERERERASLAIEHPAPNRTLEVVQRVRSEKVDATIAPLHARAHLSHIGLGLSDAVRC